MVGDPIADLLIQIKNAYLAHHPELTVPYSRQKAEIARILERENLVGKVNETGAGAKKAIVIELLYKRKTPRITTVRRISKPGCRVYSSARRVPWVRFGPGLTLVSTSAGILTDRQAREKNLGGEVICQIW